MCPAFLQILRPFDVYTKPRPYKTFISQNLIKTLNLKRIV